MRKEQIEETKDLLAKNDIKKTVDDEEERRINANKVG